LTKLTDRVSQESLTGFLSTHQAFLKSLYLIKEQVTNKKVQEICLNESF